VSELQILGPTSQDVACVKAQEQGTFAVAGAASSGESLCANTVWDISAVTLRANTSTTTSDITTGITQGIGVRIPTLEMVANCP
jgi:hypothetical protein